MSNLVDKDILMKQLKNAHDNGIKDDFKKGLLEAQRIVINMPVENERQKGNWIYHRNVFGVCRECSACKVYLDWDMPRNSFCPNCGADMRGDE